MYVLDFFGDDLKKLGLHEVVRASCFRIKTSVLNFLAILKLLCPASGTFFMPVGELRMALHKILEVSNLPMGSLPYEEYFPCADEFKQLEKKHPSLFETYRELMCHFYICLDINRGRGRTNSLKIWAEYLRLGRNP